MPAALRRRDYLERRNPAQCRLQATQKKAVARGHRQAQRNKQHKGIMFVACNLYELDARLFQMVASDLEYWGRIFQNMSF